MMVTVSSIKKTQEPDLLLDQPRYIHHPLTNNLSEPHKSHRHYKTKNRRHYASEDSAVSASTTLTSVSSVEERAPVDLSRHDGDIAIDGLDENLEEHTRWSQETDDLPRHHHNSPKNSQEKKKSSARTPWVLRTKPSSSSSSSTSRRWNIPFCPMTTPQLIVLVILLLLVSVAIASFLTVVFRRSRVMDSSSSDSSLVSSLNINSPEGELKTFSREEESDDTISPPPVEEGGGGEQASYDYDEESSENEEEEDVVEVKKENQSPKLDLKEVSRLSWDMLNSNQDRNSNSRSRHQSHNNNHRPSSPSLSPPPHHGILPTGEGGVVLPSKMIFTSSDGELGKATSLSQQQQQHVVSEDKKKKRNCCRTQKYNQVIKREGCDPLTITNKMCFGQCVSVWVPGLFASFPVCKPSRSNWRTVVLTCGKKKRRIKVEKVRRCSCMEIDPTTASSSSSSAKR